MSSLLTQHAHTENPLHARQALLGGRELKRKGIGYSPFLMSEVQYDKTYPQIMTSGRQGQRPKKC